MKTTKYIILWLLGITALNVSCKKYLEEIPDKKLTIPSSLNDMRLLLDDYFIMNNGYPSATEIQSDNYYVTSANWASIADIRVRNQYLWQKDESTNWAALYLPVFSANVVLDNLPGISYNHSTEQNLYNNISGTALFFRSYYFFCTTQVYGQPYDKNTAGSDLGVVLRLNSDFNEQSRRSTNQETFSEIIHGFEQAVRLLPEKQDIKTRPTKGAAYGALARTYLAMQQYDLAGKYADSCINLHGVDSLLNYNNAKDVIPSATIPIKTFNKEIVFHLAGNSGAILNSSRAKVDSNLYASYSSNDLRKVAYFRANTGANAGTYAFKGGYDGLGGGSLAIFGGIAMDEMYLIRAESFARAGNISSAMQDLNKLLSTRWVSGTFTPLTAANSQEALARILAERRKELLHRGTRWGDLRRLMKEPTLAVIPKRIIAGVTYELTPNSPRYALQIPANVINLSNVQQNP